MYGFGRGAAASDRDADQGDLCAATRMTRWWQRPNPNSGRCGFVYLCAGLYVTNGRSDRQFWLAVDPGLAASPNRFVGHPAYGISDLHADLDRFIFLSTGRRCAPQSTEARRRCGS
jgi:hypothetical protein